MPTIEFYGYATADRERLEEQVRRRLAAEEFREQCVFVVAGPSSVRGWDGDEQPFVRVSTRSPQRARRFQVLLADLCDLETVPIDFHPRVRAAERTGQ